MKERIREIITNPIIVILLIAFAVSGVIIYGISSNMAEQKSEIVNSLDISSVSRDKDGKLIVKLTDYEASQDDTNIVTIKVMMHPTSPPSMSMPLFARSCVVLA